MWCYGKVLYGVLLLRSSFVEVVLRVKGCLSEASDIPRALSPPYHLSILRPSQNSFLHKHPITLRTRFRNFKLLNTKDKIGRDGEKPMVLLPHHLRLYLKRRSSHHTTLNMTVKPRAVNLLYIQG